MATIEQYEVSDGLTGDCLILCINIPVTYYTYIYYTTKSAQLNNIHLYTYIFYS
jgi:hypothetical protein